MTADANAPIIGVPSPCVRNCCLDERDVCLGCYRHIEEIIRWAGATDGEKLEVLERCRARYRESFEKRSKPG
jgi:predicted Fe-S protein YdhL (DUF1289 family)